jgi:hypothetical protein
MICSNARSRKMLGLVAADFVRRRRTHHERSCSRRKSHLKRETSFEGADADSATLLREIFV